MTKNIDETNPNFDKVPNNISIGDIAHEVNKTIEAHDKVAFPVGAFPRRIQEVIEDYQKAFNLPVDYYGSAVLAAASCLIGNSFKLEFKNEWIESAVIYIAVVGKSSIGKTPAINAFLKPLREIEAKLLLNHKNELLKWEEEKAIAIENKEKAPDKPVVKELIINDATLEAIHKALNNNPNGLLFFQDELIAWIKSLNQYRKGSDEQFWMSTWRNTAAKVSRKGSDTISIQSPYVSVIGGIQPKILNQLVGGDKMDNGFLARLLFAYPEHCKKQYLSEYEPKKELVEQYRNIFLRLYNYSIENNACIDDALNSELESKTIKLSDDANIKYRKWHSINVDDINKSDDIVSSILGKLESYCLRIALILEVLGAASDDLNVQDIVEVSEESILNSIEICEYFRVQSLKVLSKITNTNPLDDLNDIQLRLYSKLPDSFETAEGRKIAIKENMSLRTFQRFLNKKELFKKEKHGTYEKLC